MKLEDQCVSLELAKKLKELGVKQKSLFCWYWLGLTERKYELELSNAVACPFASAFTVAELGEMLPNTVPKQSRGTIIVEFWTRKGGTSWYCNYVSGSEYLIESSVAGDTEADARAKMLIYLLENKIITL